MAAGNLACALILIAPLAAYFGLPQVYGVTGSALFAVVWLGAIGAGLAYVLRFYLAHAIGISFTTLAAYMVPVAGVTISAVLLGETVSATVLLTTHSVVALLAAGPLAKATGSRAGLTAYRRANLMDLTVCTYPFLLPFFIPTILAASTTGSGADLTLPGVSPFEAGFYNAHSWALLVVLLIAIMTGWGRRFAEDPSDGDVPSATGGGSVA